MFSIKRIDRVNGRRNVEMVSMTNSRMFTGRNAQPSHGPARCFT